MGLIDVTARMASARLQPQTAAGAIAAEAAERFAAEFAESAFEHDRSATFATEHLDKLRSGGFLLAPVPTEFGGGGVDTIHDMLVASSRLAAGDPSTTIGVNMHFAIVINMVRGWQVAAARGQTSRVAALAGMIRRTVDDDIVYSSAVSEAAPQDLTRPTTTARRTESGWVVDGHKVFCTMAPAATLITTAVRYKDQDGVERTGFAFIPSTADGVIFNDDWDAIGMRASESGTMTLRGVELGADAVRDGFPSGRYATALYDRFLASGAFHAAAALGIAESAHARALEAIARRRDTVPEDPHAMSTLAANIVELTAMRASLGLAGRRIDEYFAAFPCGDSSVEEAQVITAEVQAAKAFICDGAPRVADRALALSGGAGYMASHPLAKAWRDARAGAFMHPFGANRAYELVARTALGLDPRPEPGATR
ncbi:acyl-CoA dehydrogenase family protein [Desertimonas flava]|uniref:acyl-CoA dehydrogenase family protein n=1 Tax=Desertimonas flava TaxID=2064846 RepID=UPI000E341A7B|nr:acyl-CoA dehydrogenase family protein [Desertimonas flava]